MSMQLEQAIEDFLDLLAELIARRHLQNQQSNLESSDKLEAVNTDKTNTNKPKARNNDNK